MLTELIAHARDLPMAEAATQAAVFVKYFAAAIILSQGSLIGTFGSRYAKGKGRLVCTLIFAVHAALAAMVVWLA